MDNKENFNMSAVEFLKKFKTICNEDNCNTNCPFDDENEGCSFYKDDIHVIIRKVEAWIKAHSIANLTERQKIAIKGRIAEGYLWVSRDESTQTGKCVYFFDKKPFPSNHGFDTNGGFVSSCETSIYDFVTYENSPIYLPDLLKENN